MRRFGVAVGLGVAAGLGVAVGLGLGLAHAGHDHGHHDPHPVEGAATTLAVDVSLGVEVGESTFGDRDLRYDTLAVAAGARWGRVGAAVHVPLHRIAQDGDDLRGPGDPHVEIVARGLEADGLAIDGVLGAMVPVGDADDGLGMGHWMIMPAARASFARDRWRVGGRLGYGRALGGEHDHAVPWPLVAPMNGEQVEFGASAGVALGAGVALDASGALALPIGAGDPIADVGLRVARGWDAFTVALAVGSGGLESPIGLHAGLELGAAL